MRCCGICHGFYPIKTISRHLKICLTSDKISNHITETLHNLVIGDVNKLASARLRQIILRFRDDEIAVIAKKDPVIIIFGNWQSLKYRTQPQHATQIRCGVLVG